MYIQFTYLSAHNLLFSLLKKAAYSILCPCMYIVTTSNVLKKGKNAYHTMWIVDRSHWKNMTSQNYLTIRMNLLNIATESNSQSIFLWKDLYILSVELLAVFNTH